jgi:hypothetical protein
VIVISGALVLVALVLLVLGLTMQDLTFVYASIAVSLVSFVFLVIGILQRRGEQPAPEAAGTPPVVEEPSGAEAATPAGAEGAEEPEPAAAGEHDEPVVLVVPGRPRYHVEGCRYLTGKQVDEIGLHEAREHYSACGVCKPEAALAARLETDEQDEVVDSGVPGVGADGKVEPEPEPEPEREPVVASGRGSRRVAPAQPGRRTATTAAAGTAARRPPRAAGRSQRPLEQLLAEDPVEDPALQDPAVQDPAVQEPAVDQTARPLPGRTRTPGTGARARGPVAAGPRAGSGAPGTRAATVEPDGDQGAPRKAGAGRGRVVVIPDRGRFHTPSCRFVREVLGTEELTRNQAERQGYQPCGVCKP